jgi:hypothetical protein
MAELADKFKNPETGEKLTRGQHAVGLTFNHAQGGIAQQVHDAKKAASVAIDQLYDLRDQSHGEKAALLTIAIRDYQKAQMQAVKAITWEDMPGEL